MSSKANRHDKVLREHGHDWEVLPQEAVGANPKPIVRVCRRCGQMYVRNRRGRNLDPVMQCDRKVVEDVMLS